MIHDKIKWLASLIDGLRWCDISNKWLLMHNGKAQEWNPYMSIADAWMLVEKMDKLIEIQRPVTDYKYYRAHIYKNPGVITVVNMSAPIAITEAIYKAMGGPIELQEGK